MNASPRAKSWPRGHLNTECNCVAFHMPSFQFCRSTGQKRQNWYDLAAYTSERKLGVNICGGSYVVNLFKQKVVSQKIDVFAPMTLRNNIFVTYSLTIFTALIVHSHMYWGKISPLFRRSKHTSFRKNVLNEISRKSNLNRTTWLKFRNGSFTIITPINCSVWSSGQQHFVWSKTDTLTTTSTSQLIVTSAHYTIIVKAFDCEEYLVANLLKWPWSLSVCTLENSQLRKASWRRIFAREIVDDCLQFRISKNIVLHATSSSLRKVYF